MSTSFETTVSELAGVIHDYADSPEQNGRIARVCASIASDYGRTPEMTVRALGFETERTGRILAELHPA